ncbi:MAG: hypothetical protein M1825_004571 [Sarcosagium campestre]|nr:MAG: hypothetical protein M1825_004571 [Sarcosagium campestre]
MSASAQAATSLLTEHLRYTPLSLIDDIINSINALLYRAVSAVEAGLTSTPAASLGFGRDDQDGSGALLLDTDGDGNVLDPTATAEINDGVQKLETLLESTVDRNFDKLEIYALRNVLSVPNDLVAWVRLPHYEALSLHPPADSPTPASANQQRLKLYETQKLHRALSAESARNAALLAQLRSALKAPQKGNGTGDGDGDGDDGGESGVFSFLDSDSDAARTLSLSLSPAKASKTLRPLSTTAAFTTSQLPALRMLLASLRPQLAQLRAAPPPEPDPEVSAQDQRSAYIEERVRRHLVQTRGLELGDDGAVRDGEWQGGGTSIDGEEVAALESAVRWLDGGNDSEPMEDDHVETDEDDEMES